MAGEELLTVKAVAQLLGLPNTGVMKLVRRGDLVAASKPAGPGTWRITESEVTAYLQRREDAAVDLEARRHRKQVAALVDSVARLSEDEWAGLTNDLPAEWSHRLRSIADTSPARASDLESLRRSYARLTEHGVEGLALSLPQDLFWAIARLGGPTS